ncbi:hypothetical protein HMPREF1408_00398 [Helicobacter pylori GAM245Ai]|nr:hypothetical protein HMPREF1408_00398 [Helicobacter pylori GAM245Ai]
MLHKSKELAPSFLNNRMQTPQSSRITPLFKETLEFLGNDDYRILFYPLKKI